MQLTRADHPHLDILAASSSKQGLTRLQRSCSRSSFCSSPTLRCKRRHSARSMKPSAPRGCRRSMTSLSFHTCELSSAR